MSAQGSAVAAQAEGGPAAPVKAYSERLKGVGARILTFGWRYWTRNSESSTTCSPQRRRRVAAERIRRTAGDRTSPNASRRRILGRGSRQESLSTEQLALVEAPILATERARCHQ